MNSKWKLIFYSIILAAITQVVLLQPAAMLQTSNYESYINSRLKFKLEYPSDWKIFELDPSALSNLKGFVSFEPLKSEQEFQADIVEETPVISIIAEQLKFKNITINEFARRDLYEITGESTFKEYSERFDKYKKSQPLDLIKR
jgi:hypothetical protein